MFAKRMHKRTKFDTTFNQEPCVVTNTTGPEAEIQAAAGNVYQRSVSHLKKVLDATRLVNQREDETERMIAEESDD